MKRFISSGLMESGELVVVAWDPDEKDDCQLQIRGAGADTRPMTLAVEDINDVVKVLISARAYIQREATKNNLKGDQEPENDRAWLDMKG